MNTISTDGTVIGWDEAGEGQPVLFVHGAVANGAVWGGVRALLPEGIRVAAMDRRGRGQSGKAENVPYSFESEADDVLAVARALGGNVILVAHSLGAVIALQALRRAGNLIAGAILYEPPHTGTPSQMETSEAMLTALDEGRDEDALIAFFREVAKFAPADLDAYRASAAWPTRVGLVWTMRRETGALNALDPDLSRYSGIRQPIELLLGETTAEFQKQAIEALAPVLPNARVTVLEGQGHAAHVQAPHLIAGAVARMVSRLAARAA
jgi:pimeloyl-ACP methyl ester carboxylesterase